MSKRVYRVGGTMTISMYVDVEAESPEQAKEIAERKGVISLCYQCADGRDGVWSTSGELDGDVTVNDEEVLDMGPAPVRRR